MYFGDINKASSFEEKKEFLLYSVKTDIASAEFLQLKLLSLLYLITEGEPYLDFTPESCLFRDKEELLSLKEEIQKYEVFDEKLIHLAATFLVGITNFNKKQKFKLPHPHSTYNTHSSLLSYLSMQHISKIFDKYDRSVINSECERLLSKDVGSMGLETLNNITKNTNIYLTDPKKYFDDVTKRLILDYKGGEYVYTQVLPNK